MDDTICAISTSAGVGAISIIRVSGSNSISIVNKIFKGKDLSKCETHTINYGHIVYNEEIIDEVLVSVMKGPKTFTTEDIVEINTHGGVAPTNKVLELLLDNGARLAEPGEFTKRAFLNGRIDLLEAEAVMDMIDSKTEIQRKLASNQISGKVSSLINDLRSEMVQIISNINVNMDYPEYDDVTDINNDILLPKIKNIKEKIKNILSESKNGKIIKEGIRTAIIGRPNVGKSSLLNALLEEDKAIVTDIAGTTRDIVEGQISVGGVLLNIIDTAGIRKTSDKVEAIGVEKSLKELEDADLILFMVSNNEELDEEIFNLLEKLENKNYIILINKIDLESKLEKEKITKYESEIVELSLINGKGIESLKRKISNMFKINEIETKDPTYLSNARSINILKTCLKNLEKVEESIYNNVPVDLIEIDIKSIWEDLGKINGTTYEEELLDEMFKRFCLGK